LCHRACDRRLAGRGRTADQEQTNAAALEMLVRQSQERARSARLAGDILEEVLA
jgi:hypothetical protein